MRRVLTGLLALPVRRAHLELRGRLVLTELLGRQGHKVALV